MVLPSILMVWMQVPPNRCTPFRDLSSDVLLGRPSFPSITLSAVMRSQAYPDTSVGPLYQRSISLGDLFVVTVVDQYRRRGIDDGVSQLSWHSPASLFTGSCAQTDRPVFIPNALFKMDKKALRSMIKIGWPAGLQSSVFSFLT